ncbi:MAG: nuclear transport factor 2 family protein [Cyclobacteriaceae bacterium]|nr:nuclear transport factor 2 family protein [Cyclobacteriaceae bacterium]
MKLIVLFLLLAGFTKLPAQKKVISPDEQQIREARQHSNQAIARHDTIALTSHWTEDFHLITSRNTEVSGREANRISFANEFKNKPDVIYVRTPSSVEVFSDWGMASESGTWTGQWKEPDGMVSVSGTYYAKWHNINGVWKIRAEVFTPQYCTGSAFCQRKPSLH